MSDLDATPTPGDPPDPPVAEPLSEPLNPIIARNLARYILEWGVAGFSRHSFEEMDDETPPLTQVDVVNVIRAGTYRAPEFVNGSWRYRIETQKIAVVIAFRGVQELRVVTTWRFK
jgi:hypothetical protein